MSTSESVGAPAEVISPPYATTPGRSRNMAAIRRQGTKPEVALRSALHRLGYRFRKDYPIRAEGKLIRPDIVFTKRKVVIFVDGCFWHSCPTHGRQPTVNEHYWSPKLAGNAQRDRDQAAALSAAGWTVMRFWEHDDPYSIVPDIERVLTGGSLHRSAPG